MNPTSSHWQKILKYYSTCVSVEDAGDVTLFSPKEGVDFVQTPLMDKEWVSSGKEKLEFNGQDEVVRSFVNGPRWGKTPLSYSYGFPCHIKRIERSQNGWSGKLIQPILIFGVDFVPTEDGCAFTLQSERPRINSAFLNDKSLLTSIEERKQITEKVLDSWDDKKSREQNLKTILDVLANLLPSEVSFSPEILDGKTTELKQEDGVWSTGVLFKNADSKYTGGLMQELRDLQKVSNPNDVWRVILDRNTEIKNEDGGDLLEITSLNDEQREAVRSAFRNTVTIVTGPPGTGKSQVILNIIANALIDNQTVLFGSKNHKAVDVVIERLAKTQSEPIVLKYGQKEKEVEFAESLLSAIERASSYNSVALGQEIRACKNDLEAVRAEEQNAQDTLLRILNRRNQISRLDVTFESLRSELPASLSKNIDPYKKFVVQPAFSRLVGSLSRLMNEFDQGLGIWSRICALFGFSFEGRILKTAQSLLVASLVDTSTVSIESVDGCRELLTICRIIEKWINNQSELFGIIKDNESEPQVEILRERINQSKERAISISVKYVDVLMRNRLRSLGAKERRDIADYVNVVRRLEGDVTGGEFAEKLRQERKRMFQSVAKAFPAMAVTNLSVRHALPLGAGVVDIVVIDEASQCDIASALPLLYRAKRAVVVGDPYQLTHISSLHRVDDQQLQKQSGLTSADDQRFLYSMNSLFELARTVVGTGAKFVHLLEHYRSRAEIITFSNKRFYGGKLSVWTDYRKLHGSGSPEALVWHDVVGEVVRPATGSAYNLDEANAVVDLVKEIAARVTGSGKGKAVSLGVVTPFREQANKIRVLVEEKLDANILEELDFTVDTAHRYQGDERDVMIFSPVVSQKIGEYSMIFLGNTVNLFNVAITRARAELHVVGDKVACAQSGISHLADFVQYVDDLKPEKESVGGKFESPWEEVLYDALVKEGIKVVPQYSLHQYRLDLAILDSDTPIDIEIDGEMWHRDIDGGHLSSDLKRDQHVIMQGWKVKRFWVYQIKNDLARCVAEVKKLVEKK